jgi:hypothetical protein
MKRIARVATVAGLAVALGGLSAPGAMAAEFHVNFGGAAAAVQKLREGGPGDLGYTKVKDSTGVGTSQLDKSVKTGDIVTKLLGKFGQAKVVGEVEGDEQDQGEA